MMDTKLRGRLASETEIKLFTAMGQALLGIQVLEECLSVSITLKKDVGYPRRVSKAEADELLKKRRALTLGHAIKKASKYKLYADGLYGDLKRILEERNWLVHKSIDDFYAPSGKVELFKRIMSIGMEAHAAQKKIENDLIQFSESNGLDMSKIRQEIAKIEGEENSIDRL